MSDDAPAIVERYLDLPVAREALNTVQLGTVPICVIPGVMGSRLIFPDFTYVRWDPDHKLAMLRWAAMAVDERVKAFRSHADLMAEPGPDPSVAATYYGPLLTDLRQRLVTPMQTPVFSIGYDWRQSNEVSGRYVAGQVRQILADTRATKAILVTHSMGGLVARAALTSVERFAESILGVIHTVQPANGAAKEYANLISGPNEPGGVPGFVFEQILGPSATDFLALMSVLPGPVQLLPNKRYALRVAEMTVDPPSNLRGEVDYGHWLQVFSNNEPRAYDANIYEAYARYEYPGVLNRVLGRGFFPFEWSTMMRQMEDNLRLAERLHDHIGDYMHPLTKVVVASQNQTLIGLLISQSQGLLGAATEFGTIMGPGDGTVPFASAAALRGTPGWPDATMYTRGEHAQIFDVEEVREFVRRCITAMIVQYSFQVNVAGP